MEDSLLILVAAENNMRHVVALAKAAHERGKCVHVLFSGRGVKLIRDPGFRTLENRAQVSICETSFREYGLADHPEEIPESASRHLATQSQHAELLAQAERHIVL